MNEHINIKRFKTIITFILCLLLCCCVFLTGCVPENQNIKSTNVDETFEEDFPLLKQVTDYLQSVSDTDNADIILISSDNYSVMNIHYVASDINIDKIQIQNEEAKQLLKKLFNRGYSNVYYNKKSHPLIISFSRFRKNFDVEYGAGYAYSPEAKGELDIQYIVSQKELSISNWYFYEKDYNEWRSKNN